MYVSDTTGGQDLLENIPEISDKFQILSKIGEGQIHTNRNDFKCRTQGSVSGPETKPKAG